MPTRTLTLPQPLTRWLSGDTGVAMDPLDADEPDVTEYHHLPDCEALAEQVKCCLQESDQGSNPTPTPTPTLTLPPTPSPTPTPYPCALPLQESEEVTKDFTTLFDDGHPNPYSNPDPNPNSNPNPNPNPIPNLTLTLP